MIKKGKFLLVLMLSVAVVTSCGKKEKSEIKEYKKVSCEDLYNNDVEYGEKVWLSAEVFSNGLLEYDDENYLLIFHDEGSAIYATISKDIAKKGDINKDDALFIRGTTEKIRDCEGIKADKILVLD